MLPYINQTVALRCRTFHARDEAKQNLEEAKSRIKYESSWHCWIAACESFFDDVGSSPCSRAVESDIINSWTRTRFDFSTWQSMSFPASSMLSNLHLRQSSSLTLHGELLTLASSARTLSHSPPRQGLRDGKYLRPCTFHQCLTDGLHTRDPMTSRWTTCLRFGNERTKTPKQ